MIKNTINEFKDITSKDELFKRLLELGILTFYIDDVKVFDAEEYRESIVRGHIDPAVGE